MNINITTQSNIKADCFIHMPEFILVQEFNEAAFKDFYKSFNKALVAEQEIIPITIDSYGGHVHSLLGMISLIQTSPVPVLTYVPSKAMSCGAILAACGTKGYRFASSHSYYMIHEVSSGGGGKITEIESSMRHTRKLNKDLYGLLDINAGVKAGTFYSLAMKNFNADLYIDPKKAKKLKLVDHVGSPKIQVEVQSKYRISL